MAFRHQIRVRYGEVDMQQVVFNAHYLAYVDDTVDTWFRTVVGAGFEETGWDIMLKKVVVEWQSPARMGEVLDLDVGVARWGHTSFDVGLTGRVDHRDVFTAVVTYVGVRHGTVEPASPPEAIRAALGEAVAV
jgi:acyl-CoA thioester hydrolase